MKISYLKLNALLLVILFLISFSPVKSQELIVGTDIVSRYIWRGSDLGDNTPSFQPVTEFTIGGFTAGLWGAYSLSGNKELNEIDIYLNYNVELENSGFISIGAVDYTNPNNGVKMGNFNNYDDEEGSGAHSVELSLGYTVSENFPLSVSINYFVYNVANNPMYFEFGYSTAISEIGFDLFLGGTPGEEEGYYGVTNFGIINLGFTATKEIKISEDFTFPLFGSVILNPVNEEMFYVVGISL